MEGIAVLFSDVGPGIVVGFTTALRWHSGDLLFIINYECMCVKIATPTIVYSGCLDI